MYIESKKELNLTVQSGWYSKKSMMDDLNWSANFACIYIFKQFFMPARTA